MSNTEIIKKSSELLKDRVKDALSNLLEKQISRKLVKKMIIEQFPEYGHVPHIYKLDNVLSLKSSDIALTEIIENIKTTK